MQIFSGALVHNCAMLMNPRPECVGCDFMARPELGGLVGGPPIWGNLTLKEEHGA